MHATTSAQPGEMLLRIDAVSARLGLRKSAIYELVRSGELRQPVKLGRASAWPSSSIDAFIAARIADSQRKA